MSTGMSLDQILGMTFQQIELSAKCVFKHKLKMITMVLEPIGAAFGAKPNKNKSNKYKAKAKPKTHDEKVVADQEKLKQIRSLGIPIL